MKFRRVLLAVWAIVLFCLAGNLSGCSSDLPANSPPSEPPSNAGLAPLVYQKTPDNIQWITNNTDPVFASDKAEKGGVLREAILNFPMTFRVVGPDSNGSFRAAILDNQLALINIHPVTRKIIPELATHWAYGSDKKTMYFKLDPDARWSDGVKVTARDYLYTLAFMRSEHIVAPWYNDYYTREIESVTAFDDYTIAVKSTKAVPDLYLKLGIGPIPEHFYKHLGDDFVSRFNWAVVPNTGAYQISDFKKGRFIRFLRKKQWWAKDKRYFKNRFNVDSVVFTVIRDYNMQWEYFKKGRLDAFGMLLPKFWHQKSDTPVINKGYVYRIWFFNDLEQPSRGLWLNLDRPIFKDIRVRQAFAHAMNMDKVISQVLRDDYFRLPQAFYGYGKYTDYTIKPRGYDISKVEKLMTRAGWQRGAHGIWHKGDMRFSATVTYCLQEHMPRLAVLKEEALKAGIDLKLLRLDSTALFKKTLEKKHEVVWLGLGTSMRPSFWQGWHSVNAHKPQTNNITNTDNPELDKLIERYRNSLDEQERIELSRSIQNKIHDICAYVPSYMVPYVRLACWRWMKLPDFHGTPVSGRLFDPFVSDTGGLFWIDEHVRQETLAAVKSGRVFAPVTIIDDKYKRRVQAE